MDEQARIQESEYEIPYHYLPSARAGKFSQHRYWSWGFRYMGGIRLALNELRGISFESLLDIGCGDGRFLGEVLRVFPDASLHGVDISQRAVALAKAMNPAVDYSVGDILNESPGIRYDVVTLIEVIEHIPPDQLELFVDKAVAALAAEGTMIITVPHANRPVIRKHYQHFTARQLSSLLSPHFSELKFIPFDVGARRAPMMWLIDRILGARGRYFLITNARFLHALFSLYLRRYLYARSERRCERLAVVCRGKRQGRQDD